MATIDSLVIEIAGNIDGFSSALSEARSQLAKFESNVDSSSSAINAAWAKWSVGAAAFVGTLKGVESAMNTIVTNAEAFKETGMFNDDDIERATKYRDLVKDIFSAGKAAGSRAALGVMDASSSLFANNHGAATDWAINKVADWMVPTDKSPIDRSTLLPRGARQGSWVEAESSMAASQAAFGGGKFDRAIDSIGKVIEGALQKTSGGGAWLENKLWDIQTKQWAWQGQLHEKAKMGTGESSTTGANRLLRADSAEGFAALRGQINTQEKILEQSKKQTDFLEDILDITKQTTDPFSW